MKLSMYFFLLVFIICFALLAVNFLLAIHEPYKEKKTPFECGFHSFTWQNRIQFTISFFCFGLVFLLLDLEIVLIYPYGLSIANNELYGSTFMLLFTNIVTFGFIFELGREALTIESKNKLNNNVILTSDFSLNLLIDFFSLIDLNIHTDLITGENLDPSLNENIPLIDENLDLLFIYDYWEYILGIIILSLVAVTESITQFFYDGGSGSGGSGSGGGDPSGSGGGAPSGPGKGPGKGSDSNLELGSDSESEKDRPNRRRKRAHRGNSSQIRAQERNSSQIRAQEGNSSLEQIRAQEGNSSLEQTRTQEGNSSLAQTRTQEGNSSLAHTNRGQGGDLSLAPQGVDQTRENTQLVPYGVNQTRENTQLVQYGGNQTTTENAQLVQYGGNQTTTGNRPVAIFIIVEKPQYGGNQTTTENAQLAPLGENRKRGSELAPFNNVAKLPKLLPRVAGGQGNNPLDLFFPRQRNSSQAISTQNNRPDLSVNSTQNNSQQIDLNLLTMEERVKRIRVHASLEPHHKLTPYIELISSYKIKSDNDWLHKIDMDLFKEYTHLISEGKILHNNKELFSIHSKNGTLTTEILQDILNANKKGQELDIPNVEVKELSIVMTSENIVPYMKAKGLVLSETTPITYEELSRLPVWKRHLIVEYYSYQKFFHNLTFGQYLYMKWLINPEDNFSTKTEEELLLYDAYLEDIEYSRDESLKQINPNFRDYTEYSWNKMAREQYEKKRIIENLNKVPDTYWNKQFCNDTKDLITNIDPNYRKYRNWKAAMFRISNLEALYKKMFWMKDEFQKVDYQELGIVREEFKQIRTYLDIIFRERTPESIKHYGRLIQDIIDKGVFERAEELMSTLDRNMVAKDYADRF